MFHCLNSFFLISLSSALQPNLSLKTEMFYTSHLHFVLQQPNSAQKHSPLLWLTLNSTLNNHINTQLKITYINPASGKKSLVQPKTKALSMMCVCTVHTNTLCFMFWGAGHFTNHLHQVKGARSHFHFPI